MAKLIEKKPDGTIWSTDEVDGKLYQRYEQDMEPLLNYTAALRKDGLTDKGMKGDGMWLYAHIDNATAMDMINRFGLDPHSPDVDKKKLFRLLNTEYKHCKTTEKNHWG